MSSGTKKMDPLTKPEEINKIVANIHQLGEDFLEGIDAFKPKADGMRDNFDYGRPKMKEPIEDLLHLPYQRFELFTMNTGAQPYVDKNGIVVTGHPTNSFIKGLVRVTNKDEGPEKGSRASKKTASSCSVIYKNENLDKEFPFDIFHEAFLKSFQRTPHLKVRCYLYRGLHLSAQSNEANLRDKIAGLASKCAATTYPYLKVGDGQDKKTFDLTKEIKDNARQVAMTLDPNYFRTFELDAKFPNDWKFELAIMSVGNMDKAIGSTFVDLEDRFYGDDNTKQRLAYEIYQRFYDAEIKKLQANGGNVKNAEQIAGYKDKKNLVSNKYEMIEKTATTYVEYRALRNPGLITSQGSVEMCLEVIPVEFLRYAPLMTLEKPKGSEFEIRIVIYETLDIPKKDKFVNIVVHCMFDPDGWGTDPIKKETDCHMKSEDGHGIFNWRMKFPLKIPCQFPRLKFAVFDLNTFGADDSLGECTISIRRMVNKLISEGRYEIEKKDIPLTHANFPGESRGSIRIGLKIISLNEAKSMPVGESWDEPNRDPFLEKPKVGRGFADFFKTGWSFSFDFFNLTCLKILIALVIGLIMIVILFVKPGILVN